MQMMPFSLRSLSFFVALLAIFITGLILPSSSSGQSLEEAIGLYQQGQLEEALEILLRLEEEDEMALLFAGKSWMDLGEYLKAGHYLRRAAQSSRPAVSEEALYTLALNEFRLKNYTRSLEILGDLARSGGRTGIASRARQFYLRQLEYLTDGQRYDTFWQTDNPGLRFDLVRAAAGRGDPSMLRAMLGELEKLSNLFENGAPLEELRQTIESRVNVSAPPLRSVRAPEGTVYPIGVALPSFDTEEPEFEVSRNLYYGITLAADEFNARNPDRKVFLRFRDTHADPDSVRDAMNQLVWNERVDAVIGPLFSHTAEVMAQLAEEYEIPMITPLANSDRINTGHNWTFQLNPTLEMHGREMARFAVRDLRLDSLAVIVEKDSPGRASALAFRQQAEELGAHVLYFMEEDFAALGYDISPVTEPFTTDSILADSLGYVPVDGIYAPFASDAAHTLVNLLMTDLEAMRSNVVVMGSEVWGNARYTPAQQNNFAIYHTRSQLEPDDESERATWFEEDYRNRFGLPPDEFSKIGYDAASWLFATLERAGNPALLKEAMRSAPEYRGLILDIHFDRSQINRRVQVVPLTERAARRMGN